jgi:hypothetical protein
MKISKFFLPFQQMLEAVTQLFNADSQHGTMLIPIRVKARSTNPLSREAERRSNQANNRII